MNHDLHASFPSVANSPLGRHLLRLHQLAAAGGPGGEKAVVFSAWIAELADMIDKGHVQRDQWLAEWRTYMTTRLPNTTGAMALLKRHGYAGDFEIIDAIYRERVAESEHERTWDVFFHDQLPPTQCGIGRDIFRRPYQPR